MNWKDYKSYFVAFGLAVLCIAFGEPVFNVYKQNMAGRARLAEAEHSRQIAVEEARAALESARYLAQAEETRAVGVANANRIIGESLKGNESYLRYLWVSGLKDGKNEVIYVPTEAGLPILEAGKRRESR